MKKLFIKLTFTLVLMVGLCAFAIGQRTVTGVITDADNGDPLIGANVLVQGSSLGTITDIDGSYSLSVPDDAAALLVSYTGYTDQVIALGSSNTLNVSLAQGALLDEVVVVGYGSQTKKEITSAVESISAEEFNQGPITDPAQLLQGKVAGLQVYNRGGDPNQAATIRLRGISTIGANVEPLVVIDGVIGASLANVDPNDIETIDVLKDGSASAIYGSRGSSGVIIVTTKSGGNKDGSMVLSYAGQYGTSSPFNSVSIMSPDEFRAAGGTDLGSSTDWVEEVTQAGTNSNHSFSAAGGFGKTDYRVSANLRSADGILRNTGFDQFNTRLNINTRALNDKLKLNFSTSLTSRDEQIGFNEALRYAVTYNPTAPILGENSPFPFNSAQFGGYFESLGLFDSFNPVSIIDQNRRDNKRKELNYSANATYSFLDNLSATFRVAQQNTTNDEVKYYPTTSLFRGNATSPSRKGLAEFYDDNREFTLYEGYATYLTNAGDIADITVTGGYSFQETDFTSSFFGLGDFADNSRDFSNLIEVAQDLNNAGFINANSDAALDDRIIAFFGRVNATIDDGIFLNASVRREGSSNLGEDNKWGVFPAFGAGVDLNKYLNLNMDLFKFRVGYGVTGSRPSQQGLSQSVRSLVNAADGGVTTVANRLGNRDLKWEEKGELNIGVEIQKGRFGATLDVYDRNVSDFINLVALDPTLAENEGATSQFQNAGSLNTKGIELSLNYDVLNNSNVSYNTGLVFSSYKTILDEYVQENGETRAVLGAPGQNETEMILVRPGQEIGQIWGPVFAGVAENGAPMFEDVNGDGMINTDQANALAEDVDFAVLGNGIPDLELGWSNRLDIGKWSVNAFFRGAFGHSLVNTFRAFYEPIVATQSSYNFINTSKSVDGLTSAQFSSLYVEKADFFKLDNLTISRGIALGESSPISNLRVSLTGQNLFVITGYTGADPEPSLIDYGSADNGAFVDRSQGDVLSPGIDRRNNYFAARTITLGVNFNF